MNIDIDKNDPFIAAVGRRHGGCRARGVTSSETDRDRHCSETELVCQRMTFAERYQSQFPSAGPVREWKELTDGWRDNAAASKHLDRIFQFLFSTLRCQHTEIKSLIPPSPSPPRTQTSGHVHTWSSRASSWNAVCSSRLRSSGRAGDDDLSESCSDFSDACSTSAILICCRNGPLF